MENLITPVIVCFICTYVGYYLGIARAKQELAQNIIDDPDRIIAIINQIKELHGNDLESDEQCTEVYVEQHNDKFFVYDKTNSLFLGQGESVDDAMKTVSNRFPNQVFFYEEAN